MKTSANRCIEPGGSVAVAIGATRAPGRWVVSCGITRAQIYARLTEQSDQEANSRPHWPLGTQDATVGDTCFLAGDFERARQALTAVMLCPNAPDNPFLWLRRGQVYFELGDMKQAQDSLASAFMLAGRAIFETEDPKYGAFILQKMEQTK